MTTSQVAEYLGVTTRRVRQLDDALRPRITRPGTYARRMYDARVVASYAASRDRLRADRDEVAKR